MRFDAPQDVEMRITMIHCESPFESDAHRLLTFEAELNNPTPANALQNWVFLQSR